MTTIRTWGVIVAGHILCAMAFAQQSDTSATDSTGLLPMPPEIERVSVSGSEPSDLDGPPAAGYILKYTNSPPATESSVMYQSSTNMIGIGTATPATALDVIGSLKLGTNSYGTLSDGGLSVGNSSANYSPTSSTWSTTGSTLLLNALDYSTIAFHDAGVRVDFIRAGAGKIQLGYNGGWGEANIGLPGSGIWSSSGNVGIGTTNPSQKLDVNGSLHVQLNAIIDNQAQLGWGTAIAPSYGFSGGQQGTGMYLPAAWQLGFSTNGTERVRIDPSGNVGIGTTTPRGLVDLGLGGLNKTLRIGDYLDVGETDLGNFAYMGFNAVLTSSSVGGGYNRFSPTHSPGKGLVVSQSGGGEGDLDFYGINWAGQSAEKNFPSDFTHIMRIQHNGNVGIGTTNPQYYKLHVVGSGGNDAAIFEGTGPGGRTGIVVNSNPAMQAVITLRDNGISKWQVGKQTDNGFFIYDAARDKDVIRALPANGDLILQPQTGNVGIGTTNPDINYKLSVKGKIRSEEVVVETGWSDFVFEDDYELPDLNQVEQHIRQNKHLPGIPTAKEVRENGIQLGEMQAKLLQKVEELTLYVIELKKENIAMKERLEGLSTK